MFTTFKNLTLATTVSIAALTSPILAADAPEIYEINVSASFDAADGTNALEMFPDITTDIQKAIAERVPLSDSAADPIIRVDVRKLALNGDTMLPSSREFNELEGVVAFQTDSGKGGQSFPVNIKAVMDETSIPEGYEAVPPSLDDFYAAMVDGFAQKVAERIGTLHTEGAKVD